MLKMTPTNDITLINGLSHSIYGKDYAKTVAYVFFDDETPIGFADFFADEEESVIYSVGLTAKYRKRRYGDFFTRSILLRLGEVGERIRITYVSDYFEKFGFTKDEKGMLVQSEKLVFPSECGGHGGKNGK